jgi:hypothetical protein
MELDELRSAHETATLDSRLSTLGLPTEGELHESVRFGVEHMENCTDNDPLSMPAQEGWGRTLRRLREQKLPQGWTKAHLPDLETVISPDGGLQIAPMQGNKATGTDRMPKVCKTDRRPRTREAIEDNQPIPLKLFVDKQPAQTIDTWFLIFYIDRDMNEVRMEISLPDHYTGTANETIIDQFAERLILQPLDLDDAFEDTEDTEDDSIDIPVTPKAETG